MIISIVNNKGGVGKSAVSQNLGHALAIRGKRVLVIDQDPQSNTTSVLAPPLPQKTLYNLYHENTPVEEVIQPTIYKNLDILPNSNRTDTLEATLYRDLENSFFMLRDRVRKVAEENYDITLIDCPPNLGLFVLMALIASDSAIVPIEAGSRYSLDGFRSAHEAILSASKNINHDLRFLRAVINMTDKRTTTSKTSVEYLRKNFGKLIFETTIPRNVQIQAAEGNRQTIHQLAPSSISATRFKALADELIFLLNGEEEITEKTENPPKTEKNEKVAKPKKTEKNEK
jgi:cellulose biosynthesis protein BcsQ